LLPPPAALPVPLAASRGGPESLRASAFLTVWVVTLRLALRSKPHSMHSTASGAMKAPHPGQAFSPVAFGLRPISSSRLANSGSPPNPPAFGEAAVAATAAAPAPTVSACPHLGHLTVFPCSSGFAPNLAPHAHTTGITPAAAAAAGAAPAPTVNACPHLGHFTCLPANSAPAAKRAPQPQATTILPSGVAAGVPAAGERGAAPPAGRAPCWPGAGICN